GNAGAVMHWDGSAWSAFAGFSTHNLTSVWGSGPRDVWAVDDGGFIFHWNGCAWWLAGSSNGTALNGVWVSGPNDAWAVGGVYNGPTAVALHWDGSTWSASTLPPSAMVNSL